MTTDLGDLVILLASTLAGMSDRFDDGILQSIRPRCGAHPMLRQLPRGGGVEIRFRSVLHCARTATSAATVTTQLIALTRYESKLMTKLSLPPRSIA